MTDRTSLPDPTNPPDPGAAAVDLVVVPPKPPAEPPASRTQIWIRSLTSLALYLAIGYFFFNQNWTLVLILTLVVVFHELGHFFAMKIFNYTDLGIFFIPLVGAFASGTKKEVSQLQSSIILMAGPVPGIIAGLLIQLSLHYFPPDPEYAMLLRSTSWILILLNLLNLLPIYPLDGGQLLHRLFLDDSQVISKAFLLLSIGFLTWFALFGAPRPYYALLLFPAYLLSRMFSDNQLDKLTHKVEAEGINLDTSYEDISDSDYWKIRQVLIREHSPFRDLADDPPFQYSQKEPQIRAMIQSLLQRTIVQDVSVPGKIIIITIWVACFVLPFLLGVRLPF